MDLLRAGSDQLGITLSEEQIAQFESYYHELVDWNQKFNLTAITEYTEVQIKHFLDSLAALPLIAEELNMTLPFSNALDMIDVGTGAGFPSVPLKIVAPSLRLTLLDGTAKKIRFFFFFFILFHFPLAFCWLWDAEPMSMGFPAGLCGRWPYCRRAIC
ncbi:MAG: 16S rRNA (guanine(527)-N(7))-methyltransferase RsmG [Caldilineaceae bacterium]|nr:16S rRNA (guanine(527)-N(7))-methyltransferase RsmG [Caldilineaceae bacterium]